MLRGVLGGLLAGALMTFAHAACANDDWPPKSAFRSADAASSPSRPADVAGQKRAAEAAHKKDEKPLRPVLKPGRHPWQWRIIKASWSAEDERGFEEFIRQLGEGDCNTVHDCLMSRTANPRFSHRHLRGISFFADCADLPYMLRGYYAWQNGLPFSFSVRIGPHARTAGHKSRLHGTQVVDRYDIVGPGPDPRLALPAISQFVSTEHFRNPPSYAGKLLNDHYPVRISRESIKVGTVIFDPDGHLAVIYKVTDDGRIYYIDAHPDNSLTRGMFNREFSRAEPPMGAGFKRWRPQRLEGARKAPDGTLMGGRIILAKDSELADWSDEQFFGNRSPRPADWKDGVFLVKDQSVDYHDFVRLSLAYPGFKYDPVTETREMLRQLCRDLKYRVEAVDFAIKAGFHLRPQPDRLPPNIYATHGDWETYSTPSRDARIKTAFEELRDEVARFLRLSKTGSNILDYKGSDLRRDLLALYKTETAACSVTYTRSNGSPVVLGFEEIKRRLFALSFDPHHCIERRWGADAAAELESCTDGPGKAAWYVAQARLRNQLVRTYGEKMDWTLAELQNGSLDIGISAPPDVDALTVLETGNYELPPKAETGIVGQAAARGRQAR